jgi:cytochrome c biogenesis protein CcmG, thiol:disulfide interchange protein DsbE
MQDAKLLPESCCRSGAPSLTRLCPLGALLLSVLLSGVVGASDLDLSAYRGKVVYIDFWASWCGPCRQSFPWLDNLVREYASQNFVVIGVNVDKDRERAERFLNETLR